MTPVEHARDQLRILKELLDLTPRPDHLRPDLASLQQALDRRKHLLGELNTPLLDPGDDPELIVIVAEARQMVAEVVLRDKAINAVLREAKDQVQRQLNRVGTNNGGILPAEAGSWIA